MNLAIVALLGTMTATAGLPASWPVLEPGADPARGVLVNCTPGKPADRPPDPARPTFVIVHGLNPWYRSRHYVIGERLGQAVGQSLGAQCNVLAWDWNGHTLVGPLPPGNINHAIGQGQALAGALRARGISPAGLHLIGQSSGCIVAASAARELLQATGQPVAQLSLIDPASHHHGVVFRTLGAVAVARRVDHYWVPGLSGFGAPARLAGIQDIRLDLPEHLGWKGLLQPLNCDHLNAVRWYVNTATRPVPGQGFGNSALVWTPPQPQSYAPPAPVQPAERGLLSRRAGNRTAR